MAARMINAPPIHGSELPPPPESEDAPAATPDSDDDGVGSGDAGSVMVLDTRGDGVTEGVGVDDTATDGLVVVVADLVGVGVDVTSLSFIVTRTSGSTTKFGLTMQPDGLLRCN